MPAKNVVKVYGEGHYYHVYNRGVNKQKIFFSDTDYRVFLSKLKGYLTPGNLLYRGDEVELVAFCLMPNHYHMLLRNKSQNGIEKFMRGLMTSYVMYANRAHKRVGSLFQGVYKASLIQNDEYFEHITRYIHLNPHYGSRPYQQFEYSSFKYYTGEYGAEWIHPELLEKTPKQYTQFCDDYISHKEYLEQIKHLLANQYEL